MIISETKRPLIKVLPRDFLIESLLQFVTRFMLASRAASQPQWVSHSIRHLSLCSFDQLHTYGESIAQLPTLHVDIVLQSFSMSWLNRVFSTGYTLQRYPRPIPPERPDFHNCDPRYGQELVKKDCKAAVMTMPWARENAQLDWGVNIQTRGYDLPMSFNAVPGDAPKGSVSM